ncbi:Copia-like polyprotein/retrotransposon [Ceratobasidium sp. AG-Ba]|nr:Copia-like polyprotein/retrotransposon [Ceratobasidium sp. AG-Ba]
MAMISDNTYKIPALKGRENYSVWKVQMRDMYEETGLWGYIDNTETQPVVSAGNSTSTPPVPAVTQADVDGWLKKKRQALGLLRRRVESGPMVHVATATEPHIAWNTLARMYEQVGTSAMTLLRQKFYGNRMAESDDLEEHIKTMRRLHDEINLTVATAGGNRVTEIEWVEQLVASLPESYDMMVSMIDFTFNSTTDPNGIEMSQKIQTRLLNEANRRKTRASGSQSTFYSTNTNRDHRGRFLPENKRAIDRTKNVCHNCGRHGHKKFECRKPGGGAYHEKKKSKKPRFEGKSRKSKGESVNIAQASSTSATGANTDEFAFAIIDQEEPSTKDKWPSIYHFLTKDEQYIVGPGDIVKAQLNGEVVEPEIDRMDKIMRDNIDAPRHLDEIEREASYTSTIVDTITKVQPLYLGEKEVDKYSFGQADGWIVDSASTCHVTNEREHFQDYSPSPSTVSGIGGDQGIEGRGRVILHTAITEPRIHGQKINFKQEGMLELINCAFVPKSPVNLISLSQLTDQFDDLRIEIQGDMMIFIWSRTNCHFATAIKLGNREAGNHWHMVATAQRKQYAYTVTRSLKDWHQILGHIDPRHILKMEKEQTALGLHISKKDIDPNFDCIGCLKGKSVVRSFKKAPESIWPQEIGDVVYSDVWGPATTTSLQGHRWYISFTDGCTHLTSLWFMKHKNEAFNAYQYYEVWLKTQKGRPIKRIHFDNGRELIHGEFRTHCQRQGTEVTTTAPYSSQQNGYAEQLNRQIVEKARSMIHGNLNTATKEYLWEEAMRYEVNLKNATATNINGKFCSPFEAFYGKKPHLEHFQQFGTTCQVLIQTHQSKLKARTKSAIFTGINITPTGTWRYIAPPYRAIQFSRNVYFPKRIADPAHPESIPPLGTSVESEIQLDDWLEVTAPIEGEHADKPEQSDGQSIGQVPQISASEPAMAPKVNQTQAPMNSNISDLPQNEETDEQVTEERPEEQQEEWEDINKPTQNEETPSPAPITSSPMSTSRFNRTKADKLTRATRNAFKQAIGNRNIPSRSSPAPTRSRTTGASTLELGADGRSAQLQNRDSQGRIIKPGPQTRRSRLGQPEFTNWVADMIHQNHLDDAYNDPDNAEDFDDSYGTLFASEWTEFDEGAQYELDNAFYVVDDEKPQLEQYMRKHHYEMSLTSIDRRLLNDSPTFKEAMEDPRHAPQWQLAMDEEHSTFIFKKVFDIVPTPKDTKIFRCIWLLKLKFDEDGNPMRYKARLVLLGNKQCPGWDFMESFAATVQMDSVRIVFALANHLDLDIHQMDVKAAYLNAPLKERIYVQAPEGYPVAPGHCWRLNMTMYGLHQGAYNWQIELTGQLSKCQFRKCLLDECVWTRSEADCFMIIMFYVDDIVICCTKGHAERIKAEIKGIYDCKDLGEARHFLGMKITRDREAGTLTLNMPAYIDRIIDRMGLRDANTAVSPMNTSVKLEPRPEGEDAPYYPYNRAIGQLMWLAVTCRPDIAFSVNLLATFLHNFDTAQITAVKRVYQWLKATIELGLTYNRTHKPFMEVGYVDSDFASQANRRSISGNVFMFGGAAVSWTSKRQNDIATSTSQAEFTSCYTGSSQAEWLRMFLGELGCRTTAPTHIFCDNAAAIKLATDPAHLTRTKHIDVRLLFIREKVTRRHIAIVQIPTEDNLADAFTKPLQHTRFWYLIDSIMGLNRRDFAHVYQPEDSQYYIAE